MIETAQIPLTSSMDNNYMCCSVCLFVCLSVVQKSQFTQGFHYEQAKVDCPWFITVNSHKVSTMNKQR